MLNRLLTTFVFELTQIFKRREMLSTLVAGAVIYFFFYPVPYDNEEVREVPVVVIDQDQTTMSHALIRRLDATDSVSIKAYASSMQEAEILLKNREVYGILVIPFKFEQKVLEQVPSAVSYYGDASYVVIFNNVSLAVQQTLTDMGKGIIADRRAANGLDPVSAAPFVPVIIPLYNPQAGYATYVVPPAFVLIVHQCLLITVMLAGVLLRKDPFYTDPLRSNVPLSTIIRTTIIGRLFAFLSVSIVIFSIYMFFTPYWYQLPHLGSIPTIMLVGVAFLISVILFGIFISQFIYKMDNVFLMLFPMSIPIFFLSGIAWPTEMMPDFIIYLSKLIPAVPAINALVRLNQMGADFHEVLPEFFNLLALCILYGTLATLFSYRTLIRQKKLIKESSK